MAAEVAGFGVASVGRGGVDELLGSIAPGTRLLHLCGEDRRPPDRPTQPIRCVTVYRARTMDPADSLEVLRGQVAAVHSPRAAKRLAELVDEEARSTIRVAAISEATADAAGPGWAEVRVASVPNDSALLALARGLCDT
jgi:uroporphyrinogen-III synthase